MCSNIFKRRSYHFFQCYIIGVISCSMYVSVSNNSPCTFEYIRWCSTCDMLSASLEREPMGMAQTNNRHRYHGYIFVECTTLRLRRLDACGHTQEQACQATIGKDDQHNDTGGRCTAIG